ncbi:MAG TPA: hypothetical protein VJX66_14680, partial [Amycolatopsis sp.]|nr:hypothetical protein [Amycolatopsis sp.]
MRRSARSIFVVLATTFGVLTSTCVATADPAPPPPSTSAKPPTINRTTLAPAPSVPAKPEAKAQLAPPPPGIPPVQPVDPGPDGTVDVHRGPSSALQPIAPLPALNPPNGSVAVPSAPFAAKPPVTPVSLALPAHPGQELVDATNADAKATLGAAGRLNPDGTPALDANALQPQVSSARFIDPAKPATLQQLIDALTSGNIPPPLPVDPLALLQNLPDGIPRITYRVCSESATKPTSCSLTLPLGVPALVDVTGDRTPDTLVDLVPAAALGDVLAAAHALLDVQRQIDDARTELNAIIEILKDPVQAILHPELVLRKLQLEKLVQDLAVTLQQKLDALLELINLGVAVLEIRLPTSETTGSALNAHVWTVYDLPTHKRLSAGFDGLTRGSGLPTAALGVYTFNPAKLLLQGIYDVNASLITVGAGPALAVTAGLSTVTQDDVGTSIDPTVASARFSPVPTIFSAHAVIDPGAQDRPETASVSATSSSATTLDTLVLSNHRSTTPHSDGFTQLKIDKLPTSVSATVTRPLNSPNATVHYTASATIANVLFANFDYGDTTLNKATQVTAVDVPASFDATLNAQQGQNPGSDVVSLHYTASSKLTSLAADYYDGPDGIVGRGSLKSLPTQVDLTLDRAASHATFTANDALGEAAVDISRNLGAYAPIAGDHATVITNGNQLGISAKVTGLKSVDAFFDNHPRLNTQFVPGGQPFEAGADLDNTQHAQATVTNLPATLSVDADTVNRKIAYRASEIVHRVHVAYTNTATGPTLVAAVNELPSSVDLMYQLGDTPRVTYKASSVVPRIELFVSQEPIVQLRPDADHYLSAAITDLPTDVDVALDFPKRHLEGTMSAALGGIDVVARFPVAGRDWTADGVLTGVPAHFDADFAEGTYRFRGLSGPLGSANLTVTNHAGAIEPTGQHVAAYFRQANGDMDGSVSVKNLSLIEYTHTGDTQTARLQVDTGGEPVYVAANVLLAADGVDDTRLAVSGHVDNLPTNIEVAASDGKLTYTADKNVGLALEAHVGKIAALNGLGVPLFPNGVAASATGCDSGAGCAKDSSTFCTAFARCFGVAATVQLPGLPTSIVVDTKARTVSLTGYRPPSAPLQAYVRVNGLIDALPDVRALATLSGLPSPLDLTVGPATFEGSTLDAQYHASAPLGDLRIDAQATTTNAQFPELRGSLSIHKLPAAVHITGQFGAQNIVSVDDSAPIDSIAVTVTGPTTGYLRGSITGVPQTAKLLVDLDAKHADATMSAPITSIDVLAHAPYQGRTWSAHVNVSGIPGHFNADFGGGTFAFRGLSGPLGHAAIAVTNHPGATEPDGDHASVYYQQSSGDLDAGAALSGLTSAEYGTASSGQTFTLNMAADTIALDANVLLAAAGMDDTQLAVTGFLSTPNTLHLETTDSGFRYHADRQVGLQLALRAGKLAALKDLGAPLFGNGIAARARACNGGDPGCAVDQTPFCTALSACFGAVGTVNLPGLPTDVTIDLKNQKVTVGGLVSPGNELKAFVQLDGLVKDVPHAAGLLTLSGLPSPLDLTVGPFTFPGNDVPRLDVGYTASGPLGTLGVVAEATTAKWGSLRGLAHFGTIPASAHVTGYFGSVSNVTVDDSAPIGDLRLEVTGVLPQGTASALVEVRDVPAKMSFDVHGFGKDALGVPTISYTAGASTLKGQVEVEAALIQAFSVGGVNIPVAGTVFAGFTNLGGDTTIVVNPDTSVRVKSAPQTDELWVSASVDSKYDRLEIDKDPLFEGAGFTGTLKGDIGVPTIHVGTLRLDLTGLRDLTLHPGAK